MVAVDAATRAALAVVPRQRGNERVAVAGHIVVIELVYTADAVANNGGALRVLGSHVDYNLNRNIAGRGSPFQRIGLHVLPQARELSNVALAVHSELAFQCRSRTLGGVGHRRVRRFVPHIESLHFHRFAGFRIHRFGHIGQAESRFGINQERQRGVSQHMLAVVQLFIQDVLSHAEEERRIGTSAQANPLIRLAGRRTKTRIEANDLRTRFLGIHHGASPSQARLNQIAICHQHHRSLIPLPDGVLSEQTDPWRKCLKLAVALT